MDKITESLHEKGGILEKLISGGIQSFFNDHGKIDFRNKGSAAKRVAGTIRSYLTSKPIDLVESGFAQRLRQLEESNRELRISNGRLKKCVSIMGSFIGKVKCGGFVTQADAHTTLDVSRRIRDGEDLPGVEKSFYSWSKSEAGEEALQLPHRSSNETEKQSSDSEDLS